MTKPIFSSQFYTPSTIVSNERPVLANHGQTVTVASDSSKSLPLWDRIKRYFVPVVDQEMMPAFGRLQKIYHELQSPESKTARVFAKELHKKGFNGLKLLKLRFIFLDDYYNPPKPKHYRCLFILNIFRKMFGYPPLVVPKYSTLSFEEWKKVLDPISQRAFQLSKTEKKQLDYSIKFMGQATPPSLNNQEVKRLELGLVEELKFESGEDKFDIIYEKSMGCFALSLSSTNRECFKCSRMPFEPFVNKGPQRHSVRVIETDQKGRKAEATLFIERVIKKRFFGGETRSINSSPSLQLKPGATYTIESEGQPDVTFVLKKRTPSQ